MPQHTRRPPAPPAPEFYIADPPTEQTALGSRPSALGEARSSPAPNAEHPEPSAERRAPRAESPKPSARQWHQTEGWAVVMLVSFAIMLLAIYVPGRLKLVLIGVSALTSVAGIAMLGRRGLFDETHHD